VKGDRRKGMYGIESSLYLTININCCLSTKKILRKPFDWHTQKLKAKICGKGKH